MATYQEIEKLRTGNRHYVKYEFNKLYQGIPDAFDINATYCQYYTLIPNSNVHRFDVTKDIVDNLDYQNADVNKVNFRSIEKTIENILRLNASPKQDKEIKELMGYFKSLLSHNNGGNDAAVRSLFFGTATIDFGKLLEDLSATQGDLKKVKEILKILCLEVNATALNGMFSKLFNFSDKTGKNVEKLNNSDKVLEGYIVNLYNKVVLGIGTRKALNIPDDYTKPYGMIIKLQEHIKSIKELRNLSQIEIMNKVILPFEKILK